MSRILIYSIEDPALSDPTRDDVFQEHFNRAYGIYALNLPTDIAFTDERVPLEDMEIRERYDRELLVNTYWQSNGLLLFKRTHKYFPLIEPVLKKNGIPDDFKYLAIAESGLQNIVSPAGATGFWQLMESAAKEIGLEVSSEVDKRYNFIKATEAACSYLNEAYDRFGRWTLAVVSYNMGMNGLSRQLERQEASSHYDLTLNAETSRYLFRIMAIKQVMENPEDHGFHFRDKDLYSYPSTYLVKVDTAIERLAEFARQHHTSYRVLKVLNPWMRQNYLKNSSKNTYWIKLPKEGFVVESFNPDTIQLDSSEQHYMVRFLESDMPIDSLSKELGYPLGTFLEWNDHLDSNTTVLEGEIYRVLEDGKTQTTVSSLD